ncbi:LIM and calponin homology domains-containing protein 1-like [Anguilla rostrata]|uniref:LIM and calponin homology domains-containing protein 1-like n=1 Tax=Anguilla rostrata TaxID=7938 RepID=UPI0030CAEF86
MAQKQSVASRTFLQNLQARCVFIGLFPCLPVSCDGEQEQYEEEQEKLRREWERAQKEVAEEERKYHEEERRILEETVAPLTPRSSRLSSPTRGDVPPPGKPQDAILPSPANLERMQELLDKQATRPEEVVVGQKDHSVQGTDRRSLLQAPVQTELNAAPQQCRPPVACEHNTQRFSR